VTTESELNEFWESFLQLECYFPQKEAVERYSNLIDACREEIDRRRGVSGEDPPFDPPEGWSLPE